MAAARSGSFAECGSGDGEALLSSSLLFSPLTFSCPRAPFSAPGQHHPAGALQGSRRAGLMVRLLTGDPGSSPEAAFSEIPLCPGGGSREKETREAPWLLVSRWLRISRGRELGAEECVPAMLRNGALPPEALCGRLSLSRSSRGPFRSGPGKWRHHEAPPVTLMKGPVFLLSCGRTGAGLRPGSSGRCPLCPPWKEPAARFGLWEPGLAFHLSSRLVLLFRRSGKARCSSLRSCS